VPQLGHDRSQSGRCHAALDLDDVIDVASSFSSAQPRVSPSVSFRSRGLDLDRQPVRSEGVGGSVENGGFTRGVHLFLWFT
jgi:hypothetical protein